KPPSCYLLSVAGDLVFMADFHRPGKAFAKGGYANAKSTDDERSAAAGVGHARAEWSIFDAEAKGPNAGIKLAESKNEIAAMGRAELASASATSGALTAKVGLAVDTGVGVNEDGVEAKVLGTGISLGRKVGISLLGNEISFKLW
uniref:Uncharacterized protein n=1 Tax=Acanthochromis polyacanthus TaxID=80966 RepID=A0A3Q1EML9_9TELE